MRKRLFIFDFLRTQETQNPDQSIYKMAVVVDSLVIRDPSPNAMC